MTEIDRPPLRLVVPPVPQHDSPVGKVHPYWARKPLNVVVWLMELLSEPGDVVVDPFSGSGTTMLAGALRDRLVVAADINPLSSFLTRSIALLASADDAHFAHLAAFSRALEEVLLPVFRLDDVDTYVERERYQVHGQFEHGQFTLELTGLTACLRTEDAFTHKRVVPCGSYAPLAAADLRWTNNPIDFDALVLEANARIAVPRGATLAHYFTPANRAAINMCRAWIDNPGCDPVGRDLLRLLLSSCLPLLRLSDKKASSQWPYWRPKSELTSRNPVLVFRKRLDLLTRAASWLREQGASPAGRVITSSVDDLVPAVLEEGTADLVLTDPPYADQVPYLEYSSMWIQLLGLELSADAYSKEIVKSNAASRQQDSAQYQERLERALAVCAHVLRPGGHCVWFYQDSDLRHWAGLWRTANQQGLHVLDIVPIPKQRRSMKTVTSPGRTLDGDLVLVWRRGEPRVVERAPVPSTVWSSGDAPASLADAYADLLRRALLEGWIEELAARFPSASTAVRHFAP